MKKGRDSGGKDEEGRRLWRNVTRSMKPYSIIKKPVPKPSAPAPRAVTKPLPLPKITPRSADATPPSKGFDRSTETKLKRGKLPLEGRLDLHGMTQAEAFNALHRFLDAAVAAEKRTLLIITGKGGLSAGGVLKRMLPQWLEESPFRKHVLALTPAAPKDGGGGAFYLRLRKQR